MIVDVAIQTAARVRKPRSRSAVDAAHVVKRPFRIASATDADAPIVARSGTDEKPFADPKDWRIADGRFMVDVGRAAEAGRIVAEALSVATERLVSLPGSPVRPKTTPGDVRDVDTTNEDAVTAWATDFLAARYLVVGTRLFEAADPPVVTVEQVASRTRQFPVRPIPGLPACLWDLDAETVERLHGRKGMRTVATEAPRVLRPDLLAFDRDAAVVRRLAKDCLAAARSESKGALDPLAPSTRLARGLRNGTGPEELLGLARATAAASADPSMGWNAVSLASAAARSGLSREPATTDFERGSIEIPLLPGRSTRTTIRPRVVDPASVRVVAVVRHRRIEPTIVATDAEGLMADVRAFPAGPPIDMSSDDGDALWRTRISSVLLSAVADREGTDVGRVLASKPTGRSHDEAYAERVRQIAETELVLVEGRLFQRIDEPFVVLDTPISVVECPIRGTGLRRRRAMLETACSAGNVPLPFGMTEAAFAAEAGAILRPDVPAVSVEVMDPSAFPLAEARRVAAATALRIATRVPADLLGEEGRAADTLAEAAEAVVSGRGSAEFEAAVARFLDLAVPGGLLSPLAGADADLLSAWLAEAETPKHEDEDVPIGFSL